MTKNEMGAIIAMINAAYPNHFARVADIDMLADMWTSLFAQYSGEQVTAALKQYMLNDTKGYGPAPGQLIHYLDQAQHSGDLCEGEAWALVYRAGCNGIYYAQREYDSLPEPIRKALGSPLALKEIALAEEDSVSVIESNFKRSYRQVMQRVREDRKVSPDILKMLEEHGKKALHD